MTLEHELTLSYYKELARMDDNKQVWLVQDLRDKKLYIKKILTVFQKDVYTFLKNNPVPDTPRIYEIIADDSKLFVIEEYIHGVSLRERLNRGGPLQSREAVQIAISVCRIVAEFHKCTPAIINRDIKPENIMITPDGAVKLIDMNAAKFHRMEQTQDTHLLGTQGYAAPEQYGFGASGPQTDLYAIGILLNEMLTGAHPNLIHAHGRLGKIIDRCIEFAPKRRFRNINSLIAALENANGRTLGSSDSKVTKWLIPGFRSGTVQNILTASIGYTVIFALSLTLQSNSGPDLIWMDRFSALGAMLTAVFVICNYRGIHNKLPLTKHPNIIIRTVFTFIWAFLGAAIWLVVLTFLEAPLLPQ